MNNLWKLNNSKLLSLIAFSEFESYVIEKQLFEEFIYKQV